MMRIIILSLRKVRRDESDVFYKNFLKKNMIFQRKTLVFQRIKGSMSVICLFMLCMHAIYVLSPIYACVMCIYVLYVDVCSFIYLFLLFYQENDDILL